MQSMYENPRKRFLGYKKVLKALTEDERSHLEEFDQVTLPQSSVSQDDVESFLYSRIKLFQLLPPRILVQAEPHFKLTYLQRK
jgi:rubrerythrin